ncbi:MAG: hypothetical protein ABIB65_01625, partial [Candidatus Margulisiibacteriota bacterium]
MITFDPSKKFFDLELDRIKVSIPEKAEKPILIAQRMDTAKRLSAVLSDVIKEPTALRGENYDAAQGVAEGKAQQHYDFLFDNLDSNKDIHGRAIFSDQWDSKDYAGRIIGLAGELGKKARYYLGTRDYGAAAATFSKALAYYDGLLKGSLAQRFGREDNDLIRAVATNSEELRDAIKEAVNEVKYFKAYTEIASKAPEINPTFQRLFEDPNIKLSLTESLKTIVDRVYAGVEIPTVVGAFSKYGNEIKLIGKANFYLKLVKVLKLKNGELAKEAIKEAEKILTWMLKGSLYTESFYSVISSLAWLYNLKADLAEERILLDKDASGKLIDKTEYAQKAAAIYKVLLTGLNDTADIKISTEEKTLLASISPVLADKAKLAEIAYIGPQMQKALAGQSPVSYGQINPHASVDLFAQFATSEVDLLVNLAENSRLAGDYEDAQKYYNLVLKNKGNLENLPWIVRFTILNANVGLAQTNLELAAKVHSLNQDYDLAKAGAEDARNKTQEALAEMRDLLKDTGISKFMKFRCQKEVAKAGTTLGWALNSLSNYERELGNVKQAKALAKQAENIYRAYQGNNAVSDDNTALINTWYSGQDAKRKTLLNLELNLSPEFFRLGVADSLQNQNEFRKAISEYDAVIAASRERGFYNRAVLGRDRARIAEAKAMYTRDGHLREAHALIALAKGSLEKFAVESETPKARESERLNARLMISQLLGTQGYLHIQGLQRASADANFDEAGDIVLKVIDDIKADKYTPKALREAYTNPGLLYFTHAEIIKARWQMDKDPGYKNLQKAEESMKAAETEYKKLGSTAGKIGKLKLLLARADLAATQARLLLRDGEFSRAFDKVGAEIEKVKSCICTLLDENAPNSAFKGLRLLSWLIGMQGGSYEKLHGEGTARKYFLEAAVLQSAILGKTSAYEAGIDNNTRAVLGKLRAHNGMFADPDFLELSDLTKAHLLLDMANILKAASITPGAAGFSESVETLKEAVKTFRETEKEAGKVKAGSLLSYLAGNIKNGAILGIAESQVTYGQMLEEKRSEYENAEKSYLQALKTAGKVVEAFIQYNGSNGGIQNFEAAKLGLQIYKTLIWVTNSLGGVREELSRDYFEIRPEFKIALILNRGLLKANHVTSEWAEIREEAIEAAKKGDVLDIQLPLDKLMDIVRKNSSGGETIFIHPEMLFATDSNMWMMRFGYIGNLIGARVYGEAIREYELTLKELTEPGIRENEFLADIHSAIADLFCYQVRAFDRARELYTKAAKSLLIFSTRQQLPEGLKGAKLEAVLEELEKCCKDMPAKALNIFCRIKFGLAKLELENWIPYPGNARKQYEE